MRMRWCAAALRAFARRWGVYLVVGAMAVGAGAGGGVDAVRAVAAWTVLPLFRAAGERGWVVVAIVLQAAAGAMLVRSLRGLLWPRRWLLAERALPIGRRDTLRSDVIVVALALSPLVVLYGAGAESLLEHDPAWLHDVRGRAIGALTLAVVGSGLLGVATLQALRRSSSAPGTTMPTQTRWRSALQPAPRRSVGPTRWLSALLALPLWRGPARRTGHTLAGALMVLVAPALAMALRPALASWCLAAYALFAMLVTSRLRVRTADDLGALRRACLPLPLSPSSVRGGIDFLVLSPILVTAPLLLASLPWAAVRLAVLIVFCVSGLACCAAEARSMSTDPVAASSRWLLCVALQLALASEVIT